MSEMMRKLGAGRIDVGVAHHEFFEDVVLDRARQFGVRHALFLGGDDIEREHRQHRAVHGHRHAHLVERDAGEQRAHVVDRIRSRRPPCRRRRQRADDRCHSRDGWRDRRRSTGPSARRRDCAGRRRWNPPRWRSRHIAGWSRAAPRTSPGRGRAGTAPCRDRCRGSRARRDRLRRRPASPRCLPASCQGAAAPLPGATGVSAKSTLAKLGT